MSTQLVRHEARVRDPSIDTRCQSFEFGTEQLRKTRFEPFRPLDDEEVMDHQDQLHLRARADVQQAADLFAFPPGIAWIEEDVAGARGRDDLWRRALIEAAPAEVPANDSLHPEQAEIEIGDVVIAKIPQDARQRGLPHSIGEHGAQTSNCSATSDWDIEICQQCPINPVEAVVAQHAGNKLHVPTMTSP